MDAGPELRIRDAVTADAEALLAIYRPLVVDAAVSFELEAPTVEEFERRIASAQSRVAWLVAQRGEDIAGYACARSYKSRAAYQWSVETAVYVHEDHRGRGVGTTLYSRLFAALAELGYCTAYAGITLPNEPSIRMHEACGFSHIGVFRRAGWKFGRWHDVSWWQRRLRDAPPAQTAHLIGRPAGHDVSVRGARLSDVPGVTACVCEAYVHYIERIGRQAAPMLQDYAEVIRRDQVHVATTGSTIVGVLVLTRTEEGLCLDNVAVRPSAWGTGIGRRLLQLAESEALRQGFTSIYLYTNEAMTEDRDLYARIGYVQYDRRVVDGYTRVFFRKTLG